jgi:hypothetical protein
MGAGCAEKVGKAYAVVGIDQVEGTGAEGPMKPELCVGRHQPPEGSIPRLPTLALSQVEGPTGSVGSTAHAWTGYTGRCIATVDAGAMEGTCMGVMAEGNRNTEGSGAEPAVMAPLGVLPSDAPKAYRDAGGDDSATFPLVTPKHARTPTRKVTEKHHIQRGRNQERGA